jgi:hypothetical protein
MDKAKRVKPSKMRRLNMYKDNQQVNKVDFRLKEIKFLNQKLKHKVAVLNQLLNEIKNEVSKITMRSLMFN